jgi:cytochrome c oxidase subunit II
MLPQRLLQRRVSVRRALALAVAVCGGFAPSYAFAEPPSPLIPASPQASVLADLYWLIFWMAVAVFVLVEGLLLYSAFRFRRRRDDEQPTQIHGNTRLELAWTVAPALIVAAIFAVSLPGMGIVNQPPAETSANVAVASAASSNVCFVGSIDADSAAAFAGTSTLNIKVTGRQWWWQLDYPEYGFETATDMVVPVGAIVKLEMQSNDVIHSWWIPQLNGKQDVNPDAPSYTWFQAERAGVFEGQCTELCGDSHAYMPMRVVAVAPDEFERWAQAQSSIKAQATQPSDPLAAQGRLLFEQKGCVSCHAIDGVEAQVPLNDAALTRGPNLSNFGGRTQVAGVLSNTPEHLAQWLANPQDVKPGTRMPNLALSQQEIDSLVAYLESLK